MVDEEMYQDLHNGESREEIVIRERNRSTSSTRAVTGVNSPRMFSKRRDSSLSGHSEVLIRVGAKVLVEQILAETVHDRRQTRRPP